ncbi:hypothetical protein BHE74_00010734 [Ensete ventricosum]|nr:hypothetical protein BHE74_00010734 [Ensete ventricosum]RZR78105.1 hypothetical protein BHM03_00003352 [Ensete ventricosum]
MSWCHPDISLGDLMQLIQGFVDILILANGYQSSGLPAVWDAPSIKKAVRWGLFFQDVFKRINDSCHFDNSMKELDAALRNLMSNPFCPQEISLLGFISSRWTNLIGQFMSHSCDYRTISEQYSVLHCVLQENTQCAHSKMEALSSKCFDDDQEKDILDCMTTFLDCHYQKLWLLPPVLVAAAIPSW